MNEIAPKGQIYICGACGKRSRDMYGFQALDSGYDESCMLNSVLCFDPLDGKIPIEGWKPVKRREK